VDPDRHFNHHRPAKVSSGEEPETPTPVLRRPKTFQTLDRQSTAALAQVGWTGQTGAVYNIDDAPYDDREPGGFAPLYIQVGTWVEYDDGVWRIED